MTPRDVARLRLRNQRLLGQRLRTPQEVVAWLGAVQAQDYRGAKWALAQRMVTASSASIDAAFDAGEILRTHVMRPTWHFVAPADIRWLLALTAPRVHRANGSMYRRLGFDDDVFRRSNRLIEAALGGGNHLTRIELATALERGGLPARSQHLAYLVMHAELDGVVCSGPLHGRQFTYALLDERVPPAPTFEREWALAELCRRFFTSHGPATVRDMAWWSGLTMGDVRRGVALVGSGLEQVDVEGVRYWQASGSADHATPPPDRTIRLLPNYDEHLVGYRDRAPSIDPAARPVFVTRTDALAAHIVVRHGMVIGGWRRVVDGKRVMIRLDLALWLTAAQRRELESEAADYGRFVGQPIEVTGWLA